MNYTQVVERLGDFSGPAKAIEDIDLPRIGHRIGVGEDEIHAVMDVESAGRGFDKFNRPRILFERHIFYRELGPGAQRNQAMKQGLAVKSWSTATYGKDQYALLKRAMKINAIAALRSCSWGLGQIMGFNCKLAGYNDVVEMIAHFMLDEDNHLEAMIAFIVNAGLDDEIRAHNWAGFARGYNGPGYKKNRYDAKLRQRYGFWLRIPDTFWEPGMGEDEGDIDVIGKKPIRRAGMVRMGMTGPLVKAWQETLVAHNFMKPADVDGRFGVQTEMATMALQSHIGVKPDGLVGPDTRRALEIYMKQSAEKTIAAKEQKIEHIKEATEKVVEDADKPLGKSTSFWSTIGGYLTTVLTTLSTLDWKIALPVILIASVFAGYLIYERKRKQGLGSVANNRLGALEQ